MVHKVWFTGLGWVSANEAPTVEQAVQIARRAGFRSAIVADGKVVATYCPVDGRRTLDAPVAPSQVGARIPYELA